MPSSTEAMRAILAALKNLDRTEVVADQTRAATDLMSAPGWKPDKLLLWPVSKLIRFISLISVGGPLGHNTDVMSGDSHIIEVMI